MDQALKIVADNVYTLKGSSAWIFTEDRDIWILNGKTGLSISLFDPKTNEVIDAIFLKKENVK